jgi:hypothetical protein
MILSSINESETKRLKKKRKQEQAIEIFTFFTNLLSFFLNKHRISYKFQINEFF